MKRLLATAALALLTAPAGAATLAFVDEPSSVESLELTAGMFRLSPRYARDDIVFGAPTTVHVLDKAYDGRDALGGGTYVGNNNAERMIFDMPVSDLFLRITDASDQRGQASDPFRIVAGDAALGYGGRRPNGNVQWLRAKDVSSILFDSGSNHDGYGVEAFTPIAPIPLPAAGLLLFGALASLLIRGRRRAA